jgi:spermidine synthase
VQTTVSVHERLMRSPKPNRILYLEGLHQSNDTPGTVYTHRRIGLMPVILHPDPANALVIGLGGGATAGGVSQDPNLQIDVVELSQSVVHGAQWFKHINYDLFQLPNVHLRVDDGRNFLALARKRYDVVTADIILPIHAGAGNLYSAEYFRLVHNALSRDGVVLQWIGPGRETEYKLIMRTFLSVFPNTTLWADGSLMVATLGPLRLSRSSFDRKLQEPKLGDFMRDMGFGSFERLLSIYVAGPAELREFVGPGPILTDDRPTTEYFLSLPLDEPDVDLRRLRGDVNPYVVP